MYSVIASDGNTYGPVDVVTLKAWCAEGRVTPTSNIVDAVSGRTMRASDLQELFDVFQPPAMSPPVPQPTAQQTYAPGLRPGQSGNPYEQPPGSPYFRGASDQISPADLAGFNFGAFALTWIWGLNHKKPILLIVFPIGFVPILGALANIGIAIWAGVNGNKWAWESGRFRTGQEMRDTEKVWNTWGIVILAISIGIGILYGILAVTVLSRGGFR